MVKLLGSKRALLPNILELVDRCVGVRTALDLFSGTSRVGHALKERGYRVLANDHNAFAHCLATCYVQADAANWSIIAERLIADLNNLKGSPGYVTETFCENARFFRPENGERIDAIREWIEARDLEPELRAILLTSLIEAADRVDSTTGLQMAYLKSWAPRAYQPLVLRLPRLLPQATHGKGEAHCLEAKEAAQNLTADLVYLDPPYNQHSYLGNYHVWESIVRWDKPPVYGVACKRVDCRERSSAFNSKVRFAAALEDVLLNIRAKYLLVSFSNEGFISSGTMEETLGRYGVVACKEIDYRRYVGAQIGIHSPSGARVGKVSHLRNCEFLYVVELRQSAMLAS